MDTLKASKFILTPVTADEIAVKANWGNSICVLFQTVECGDIQVGIPALVGSNPVLSNVWGLNKAFSQAYFYNLGSRIAEKACEISDRPVYEVNTDDKGIVESYRILNSAQGNGLDVEINSILGQEYSVIPENVPAEKRKIFCI